MRMRRREAGVCEREREPGRRRRLLQGDVFGYAVNKATMFFREIRTDLGIDREKHSKRKSHKRSTTDSCACCFDKNSSAFPTHKLNTSFALVRL